MSTRKRILFIHPDLGIGGAERLVVDAAVGLQERGHTITIYTSHCDHRHCFDEARNGILQVFVAGNSLVPHNIFGRFSILCAILRQLHLSLILIFSGVLHNYDYIFIDQLSATIPLFRLFAPHIGILFYCHFPDYLLAPRKSYIKSLYRMPFDWVEAYTTGLAHTIVVNSDFTKSVFSAAFPQIKRKPRVVYPCVDIMEKRESAQAEDVALVASDSKQLLLSINRFERKKNIALAIRAYALLDEKERESLRLVLAGGYDNRVVENIDYHLELATLCDKYKLKHITCKNFISALSIPEDIDVLFLLSIPSRLKAHLLNTASLLLYTPENEHFGIVPLEALLAELPVLAHKSGGPLETVHEGHTGWLRTDKPEEWVDVIRSALFHMSSWKRKQIGRNGRQSVLSNFSKEKMASRLEGELFQTIPMKQGYIGVFVIGGVLILGIIVALVL